MDLSKFFGLSIIINFSSYPLACNCNNRADRCEFDMDLYEKTGHGGRCIDCRGNFDGPNCDRCKDGFFEDLSRQCAPCNCDKTGEFYFILIFIIDSLSMIDF